MIVRCEVTEEMTHLAHLEAYHRVRQRAADFLAERDDLLVFTKDVEETGVIVKGGTPGPVLQSAVEAITANLTALIPTSRTDDRNRRWQACLFIIWRRCRSRFSTPAMAPKCKPEQKLSAKALRCLPSSCWPSTQQR